MLRAVSIGVLLAASGVSTSAFAATTYSAAAGFSPSANANGDWSFGQSATLGGNFAIYTGSGSDPTGFNYWSSGPNLLLPAAMHNPTASPVYYFSVAFQPGQLILHPGQFGEYSIARFTAPTSGTYKFGAAFIGQDRGGVTTTDVHLLVNSSAVYNGIVSGYQNTASSGTFSMSLVAGDTIDAAVGFGSFGYYNDSTGVDFNIELVPSPGVIALFAYGTMAVARRRRT